MKPQEFDFTPEQLKLITATVARGATPDELKLFLYRAKLLGLNPLKPGQIHFVKYGNAPGTIVVGIEGFRSIASRTGKIAGVKRGVIRDEQGRLIAGWAEVFRHDWKECAREEAPFAEYNTGRGPWVKMPETMIKKVAEAAALRMAFPDDLGGVYTKEEMDQAAPDAAPEPSPVLASGYRVPAHLDPRVAGKPIEECDIELLRELVAQIEEKYQGREIPPKGREFLDRATRVMGA